MEKYTLDPDMMCGHLSPKDIRYYIEYEKLFAKQNPKTGKNEKGCLFIFYSDHVDHFTGKGTEGFL